MADLNSLKNEKTQYQNLKNTLTQVSVYLLKCNNFLEYPSTVESYFKIDNASGDNNLIINKRNEVNSNYLFLVNQVLPEIDNKIYSINNEITQEEIRLENERRAREEAARRAQEEAAKKAQEEQNNNPVGGDQPKNPNNSNNKPPGGDKPKKPINRLNNLRGMLK